MSVARTDRKISSRITIAVCAVLYEACLGAMPAGSFFSAALNADQAQWISAVSTIMFAAGAVVSGILLGKFGPRRLVLAGGGLLCAGFILAGMFGTSFTAIMACIGIACGFGAGLGYIVPVMIGMKWYPDRRGFAAGIILCGGAFGSLIWTGAAGSWFDLIHTLSLFGLDGLRSVFLLYGIAFLVIILPAGSAMVDPPWGYAQAGWTGTQPYGANGAAGNGANHIEPVEMVKTPQFILFFAAFFLLVGAGLLAGKGIGLFGLNALNSSGLEPRIAEAVAGWAAGSLLALIGFGQAGWGSVSDMIGRKLSLAILCLIQGTVLLLLYTVGCDPKVLIFCACVIGFNLGGTFALFPVITAEYFGTKNFALNYGLLLIPAAVAALIAPVLAGHVQEIAKASLPAGGLQKIIPPLPGIWLFAFSAAGAACLVSAVLVFFARIPRKEISRFEAITRFRERMEGLYKKEPDEQPGETEMEQKEPEMISDRELKDVGKI